MESCGKDELEYSVQYVGLGMDCIRMQYFYPFTEEKMRKGGRKQRFVYSMLLILQINHSKCVYLWDFIEILLGKNRIFARNERKRRVTVICKCSEYGAV
jgi:hypothetical protein